MIVAHAQSENELFFFRMATTCSDSNCEVFNLRETDDRHSEPTMWSLFDFALVKSLGLTHHSIVYEAKEISSGMTCAIKRLSKRDALRLNSHKRIERELRIYSNLSHPNIVQLYSWFHDDSSIYMVMEFCDISLSDLMETKYSGGIPSKLVAQIAKQLLSAISHLHSLNVLHRDLKPSNMYLSSVEGGVVKLGDFGSAVHTNPTDLRLSAQGTTPYLSPEVVKGIGHSFPSDIWAFGVCLHELITGGSIPFDGETPHQIYKQILNNEYQPPPQMDNSNSLYSIMIECMQKDPANRPRSIQIYERLNN